MHEEPRSTLRALLESKLDRFVHSYLTDELLEFLGSKALVCEQALRNVSIDQLQDPRVLPGVANALVAAFQDSAAGQLLLSPQQAAALRALLAPAVCDLAAGSLQPPADPADTSATATQATIEFGGSVASWDTTLKAARRLGYQPLPLCSVPAPDDALQTTPPMVWQPGKEKDDSVHKVAIQQALDAHVSLPHCCAVPIESNVVIVRSASSALFAAKRLKCRQTRVDYVGVQPSLSDVAAVNPCDFLYKVLYMVESKHPEACEGGLERFLAQALGQYIGVNFAADMMVSEARLHPIPLLLTAFQHNEAILLCLGGSSSSSPADQPPGGAAAQQGEPRRAAAGGQADGQQLQEQPIAMHAFRDVYAALRSLREQANERLQSLQALKGFPVPRRLRAGSAAAALAASAAAAASARARMHQARASSREGALLLAAQPVSRLATSTRGTRRAR